MFIKAIVIEGVQGDVEIVRTSDGGAHAVLNHEVVGSMRSTDDEQKRWETACAVTKVICGVTKPSRHGPGGQPNATKSMINDVLGELERVAGC